MITAPDGRPIRVVLIAAVALDHTIGVKGDLPWKLPKDLARFQRVTRGHAVVMGRKTLDTLPGALKDRVNIVVTRQAALPVPGIHVAASIEAALHLAAALTPPERDRLYVVGGGEVYRGAMRFADELDITRVEGQFGGDATFPDVEPQTWARVRVEPHAPDERHGHAFTFEGWVRREIGVDGRPGSGDE